MKFSRRTEGIKAARNVFKQAREDSRCGHQIYVAAALMEYNISKVTNFFKGNNTCADVFYVVYAFCKLCVLNRKLTWQILDFLADVLLCWNTVTI